MSIAKKTVLFFDHLEDKVRGRLSKYPTIYTFIGGVALIMFWRGVWHTADLFPFLTGPVSILLSLCILLITGLFISFFITDRTILSGIDQEKKLSQRTEAEVKQTEVEVRQEGRVLEELKEQMASIETELHNIEDTLANKK